MHDGTASAAHLRRVAARDGALHVGAVRQPPQRVAPDEALRRSRRALILAKAVCLREVPRRPRAHTSALHRRATEPRADFLTQQNRDDLLVYSLCNPFVNAIVVNPNRRGRCQHSDDQPVKTRWWQGCVCVPG